VERANEAYEAAKQRSADVAAETDDLRARIAKARLANLASPETQAATAHRSALERDLEAARAELAGAKSRLAERAAGDRVEDLETALAEARTRESRAAIEDAETAAAALSVEIDARLRGISETYDAVASGLDTLTREAVEVDRMMLRLASLRGGHGSRLGVVIARLGRAVREVKSIRANGPLRRTALL